MEYKIRGKDRDPDREIEVRIDEAILTGDF